MKNENLQNYRTRSARVVRRLGQGHRVSVAPLQAPGAQRLYRPRRLAVGVPAQRRHGAGRRARRRRQAHVHHADPGARPGVAARQAHRLERVRPGDAPVRDAGDGHRAGPVGAARAAPVAVELVDGDGGAHVRHPDVGEGHVPHRAHAPLIQEVTMSSLLSCRCRVSHGERDELAA